MSGSGAPPPPPPPPPSPPPNNSKRIHEESACNDYHHPSSAAAAAALEDGGGRSAKLPRTTTESRSPLHHQLYRMPPPDSDHLLNWKHPPPTTKTDPSSWRPQEAVAENKLDFLDAKNPEPPAADATDSDEPSSALHQRKRNLLRPPHRTIIRSRDADNNHQPQEKLEVSTVVYKVGECMQNLIKLWKEYETSQGNRIKESPLNGPTLEICILAEYVTATNRQVRGGQLWGTDIYTDDSDLVAVLMHTGYCRLTTSPPPPAIQELRATIRVLPPQDCYTSTLRNNVRSRAWGAAIGCSYRVERCCIVKKGGGTIDLEPCLTHTLSVEPTLAPMAVERTMTTRAAASNALRQQRFVREVTIQYNLCNEPWIKYSISVVADKGLKKPLYTSARLKKGEVLYLETHSQRYELCYNGEKTVSAIASSQILESEADKLQTPSNNAHEQNGDGEKMLVDVFRWSRCKRALPLKMMRSTGIPLPLECVEVLEENIDWEDVQWSQTGVWIGGKEYPLARVHFLSPN